MKWAWVVNGAVYTVVESDEAPEFDDGTVVQVVGAAVSAGWKWDGSAFTPPPSNRRITRLAFRRRLTDAEKVAIYTASASSAAIRIYLDDLTAADYIDLDDSAVLVGLQALETAGLLAAGRASAIVSAVVAERERP
jgi:hypothetical protein